MNRSALCGRCGCCLEMVEGDWSLQTFDGCGQPQGDLSQGHAGYVFLGLLRQVGDMDKTDPGGGAMITVEQGVEYIVAYESTGAVGYGGGNSTVEIAGGYGDSESVIYSAGICDRPSRDGG